MSLSLLQTPATASLAQSPIIFTVSESDSGLLSSASFQYIGELYYWTGSLTNSGSTSDYTIVKYPNTAGVGIFDLNRIINSTLTDYAQASMPWYRHMRLIYQDNRTWREVIESVATQI